MKFRKYIVILSFTILGLPGLASANCGEVSITEMNWASAAVVTHISKFFMEQGYGCKVTAIPSSVTPSLTSLAETGKPEIVTELWVNGAPAFQPLLDEGKIVSLADVLSDGAVEGLWVPDYLMKDHPELVTIEGVLNNPELVGNTLHNCPDGWGCKHINESMAKALDMEKKGIKLFNHGSSETLTASIARAYENKEPWLGYYWAPTAVLGKYPMVKVDMGQFDAQIHKCNADPKCEQVGVSNWPQAPVRTVVSTEFSQKNPEISQLMSKVAFTNAQMNTLLAWKEKNSASAEETAVHFITNYQSTWSDWVSDSAKTRLASLLK